MTTMTGLSSIASLSLGLSMSMSSGDQPGGLGEKTAKLQSQLSMLSTPAGDSSAHHRHQLKAPQRSSPVTDTDNNSLSSQTQPHTSPVTVISF